jgi:hypothetical protein
MKRETAPTSQRTKTIWSSVLGFVTGIGLRLFAGLGWALSSIAVIGVVVLSFFVIF